MTAPHEKRREARHAVQGSVRVRVANPKQFEILGLLVDVSTGGFRMEHTYTQLTAGQVVEFSHDDATGNARVVWTRIAAGKVESGFLVVPAR